MLFVRCIMTTILATTLVFILSLRLGVRRSFGYTFLDQQNAFVWRMHVLWSLHKEEEQKIDLKRRSKTNGKVIDRVFGGAGAVEDAGEGKGEVSGEIADEGEGAGTSAVKVMDTGDGTGTNEVSN